jgi:type VI protein secretion system component VasF
MFTDWLGKRLFPRWQPYRRKREIKTLLVALWVGLVVAGVITAAIILANSMSLGR